MFIKGLEIMDKVEKFLRDSERPSNEGDQILDVIYIVNGLRIIFVTKRGFVGIVDTQHIRYFVNLK